ncbi:MAG: class I adenylate-forming enzyme family protein [Pseudomonadales bacterium]
MSITAQDIQQKTTELVAAEAPFELHEIIVDGQQLQGFKNAPANLIDLVQAGRGHGDQIFMVYEGERLSFTGFYQQVDALATALQNDYGVTKGDRVAIAMRNAPEWAVALVAGTLIGAIMVPLNSWGKTDELLYGVTDCDAKVLVCDAQRYALIANKLDEFPGSVIVAHGDETFNHPKVAGFTSALENGVDATYTTAEVQPEDIALILYTSGSTGFPKGVASRHVSVCQALMNMYFLGFLSISLEGERKLRGGADRETPLLTVPLFHATGLISGLLMPLQMGHKVVMMYKWETEKALQLIESEKVTGLTSVPAVLQALLTHTDYDKYDTSSLLRVSAAGAASPTGLPELIEAKVGNASRSTGWGMTETMAVGTTMIGGIYDLKPMAAGVKSPLVELRFVDPDGQELPAGEPGEIQCRGVTLCAGYWGKPEASAEIMHDGWMKTGDIGVLDEDGFLHITGRIKEIVIRGGENIYPGEIEGVAYAHEAVQENVVFGVPDRDMGEELAMVVYPQPSHPLTVEELRNHLEARLAKFKVPKYIELVDEPLPQNASGKLFKRKLQEEFVALMAG